MDLTGTIKLIRDEQTFPSGFTKREFVITTEEQYPQDIQFELLKDKTSLISQFKPGDKITVSFDIRGREWQGKYFNSLTAWRLQGAGVSQTAPPPVEAVPPHEPDYSQSEPDDLPF